MRNVPNILIVCLSMGDFLLILISVPLTATYYTFYNWPYGEAACKSNNFLHTMSLGISIFSLMALSHDRYVAIVNPMAKLSGRTTRTTIILAIVIWCLSIVFAIPDAIYYHVYRHPAFRNLSLPYNQTAETFEHCGIYVEFTDANVLAGQIHYTVRFAVFFSIPVITIAIFYIKMSKILIKSGENFPMELKNVASNNNCRQMAARKRVAYVVLSFVVLFIICWTPHHVYAFYYQFATGDWNEDMNIIKIVGFCLKFINSCINPIACYVLSGQFRKYFNRYLTCCCSRRRYAMLEGRHQQQALNSTTRRDSPTSMSQLHTQSAF